MNKLWVVLTIIFLSFSACKAQNKEQDFDWKEFVSEEGKFKATFPAIPARLTKEADSVQGLQTVRFGVSIAQPEIYFGVWYADFPNAPAMDQETLKNYYENMRDGFSKAPNIELLSEREVWTDKNLGLELVLKTGNSIVKNRFFLIKTRNFQVITSANSSVMEDAEVEKNVNKFLDSFQPIEK